MNFCDDEDESAVDGKTHMDPRENQTSRGTNGTAITAAYLTIYTDVDVLEDDNINIDLMKLRTSHDDTLFDEMTVGSYRTLKLENGILETKFATYLGRTF
jgi:hypothetical protein